MPYYAILPEYMYAFIMGTPGGVEGVDWISVPFAPPDPENMSAYRWSVSDNFWYIPYTEQGIDAHRDSMIEANVTYNSITVLNDTRTQNALLRIKSELEAKPDVELSFQTPSGYIDLGLVNANGLFLACRSREQACFDAARATKEHHAVTPFPDMDSAIAYFDSVL